MATIVRAWASELTHITDDSNGSEVQTKCGRTLKNFQLHYSGTRICWRCGTEEAFENIHQERSDERKRQSLLRKEKSEARVAASELRLKKHRQIMNELSLHLETVASDIDRKEHAAGGEITFRVDGLKFKLSGYIHG